ncbi:hypothetical protein [Bacillus sp. AFS041924]|uniref:hypothetical protein n=1 Tax=Bacillus sp. AFS041924 TaxID=2033503 RepID=UPI00159B9A62
MNNLNKTSGRDYSIVEKTLTIPKYLDDLAKEKKINFSQVLRDALKDILDEI